MMEYKLKEDVVRSRKTKKQKPKVFVATDVLDFSSYIDEKRREDKKRKEKLERSMKYETKMKPTDVTNEVYKANIIEYMKKHELTTIDNCEYSSVIIHGMMKEKYGIDLDKVINSSEFYNHIIKMFYELWNERILLKGYVDSYTCYPSWVLSQTIPSERRSFGNLNGHGDFWEEQP